MTQSKQLQERKTHFPFIWSHRSNETNPPKPWLPCRRLDASILSTAEAYSWGTLVTQRAGTLSVSSLSTTNKKYTSRRSFQFFLLQFLHLLNERDYLGLEVLLVLRIIDLGSFYFRAFLLITGILLPTERSYDTRYRHLRAWQVVRGCFSPPMAQLPLWSREIGHSYDCDHLNGKYFNLHKDVCVPCRELLGSYLLSVSPDNMLCHGKGK